MGKTTEQLSLEARVQELSDVYGYDLKTEELAAFDKLIEENANDPMVLAQLIGEPIEDRKEHVGFARRLLLPRTIRRGENAEFPAAPGETDGEAYWIGSDSEIRSRKVTLGTNSFDVRLMVTEELVISLHDIQNSKFNFVPTYRAKLTTMMNKLEDFELIQLIEAAATGPGALTPPAGAAWTWDLFRDAWAVVDPFFDPAWILVKSDEYFKTLDFVDASGNPKFTEETREDQIRRGVVGRLGTATVLKVNGVLSVDGIETPIMADDVAYMVARPDQLGYFATRLIEGRRRIARATPFTVQPGPGGRKSLHSSMYAVQEVGQVIANNKHVLKITIV